MLQMFIIVSETNFIASERIRESDEKRTIKDNIAFDEINSNDINMRYTYVPSKSQATTPR